jgi:transposase
LVRKLGVIAWSIITKGQNYNPPTPYLFLDEKRKQGIVKRIQKQITKFELTNENLGFVTT